MNKKQNLSLVLSTDTRGMQFHCTVNGAAFVLHPFSRTFKRTNHTLAAYESNCFQFER